MYAYANLYVYAYIKVRIQLHVRHNLKNMAHNMAIHCAKSPTEGAWQRTPPFAPRYLSQRFKPLLGVCVLSQDAGTTASEKSAKISSPRQSG